MPRVFFSLFVLFALVAAPAVAHANPILMASGGSSTTPTDASSALTAMDFSGDALGDVLFDLPAGTDLPPVERGHTDDSAAINPGESVAISLGPVVAYNVTGGPSSAPFNFELIGLLEPQISNVSFQSGTGPAPALPLGIRPVAVPEPVTLLLLGPAAALALRRWHRRKAAR